MRGRDDDDDGGGKSRDSNVMFKFQISNFNCRHTMTRGDAAATRAIEALGELAHGVVGDDFNSTSAARGMRAPTRALRDVSNAMMSADETTKDVLIKPSRTARENARAVASTPDITREQRSMRRARAVVAITPSTETPKVGSRKRFGASALASTPATASTTPATAPAVFATPAIVTSSSTAMKRLEGAFASAASRKRRSSDVADAFASTMTPTPKARAARRWLTDDEKPFVCGIDGCEKSYGSAPSLCAHKRARHPGWKTRTSSEDVGRWAQRNKARAAAAAAAAAATDADDVAADDAADAEEGGEDGDDDAAVRMSRQRGASGIDDDTRNTALGAYMEIVAADAHGRIGQASRAKRRLARAARDVRAALAAVETSAPERAAAASAARIFAAMEDALDAEQQRASAWIDTLDVVSHVVTSTQSFTPDANASEETRRACAVARVARDMLRAVAAHDR